MSQAAAAGGAKPMTFDEYAKYVAQYDADKVSQLSGVPKATLEEVRLAYETARAYKPTLSRFERAAILQRDAAGLLDRADQ